MPADTDASAEEQTGDLHGDVVESHPKGENDGLPPEMEFVIKDGGPGFLCRFIDTGLRLEINGETYVPDSVAPVEGYVTLSPEGSTEGMVRAGGPDVKIHADMAGDIVATGDPSE